MADFEQMMSMIQTREDLEDFMQYYEFEEKEKKKGREEWSENQQRLQQNATQDRGLGKVLLAGVGAVVGYKVLKKAFGKRQGKMKNKGVWQPGMGGISRNMPSCQGNYGCGFPQQQQQSYGDPYGRQPMMQQQPYQQQQYQPAYRQA